MLYFVLQDILTLAGDKGKWQYRTFLILWIEGIIIGTVQYNAAYERDYSSVQNLESLWLEGIIKGTV